MFEYGVPRERTDHHSSPIGNARKCHFCLHRLNVGQLPACVTTCIGRATLFGDANDPDSLVADMMHQSNVMRLKEDLGTEPRVFYLL
jgi:molybdopterin-containing oxidoreductase family iron-sulfur binding subunit